MRSGLTPRAKFIVQQMATAQMMQVCVVERVKNATYDANTLVATAGSRTQIYPLPNQAPALIGTCRIWEQQNPSLVELGESEFVAYQTILSLPWNAPGGENIAKHDEVQVVTDSSDPIRVGERYRIQSLKQGGQILATRSFVLERLEPRP